MKKTTQKTKKRKTRTKALINTKVKTKKQAKKQTRKPSKKTPGKEPVEKIINHKTVQEEKTESEKERIHPFTIEQLRHFETEIIEAGGVDELMLLKEALIRTESEIMIATHKDIEGYKLKYLNGIYEPLREIYYTEVPYVFWSKLFDVLKRI